MKSNQLNYDRVIGAVWKSLDHPAARISATPAPFTLVWWPVDTTLESQLLSDLSDRRGNTDLIAEFDSEIEAIRHCLDDIQYASPLAKWQRSKDGNARNLWASLNRNAAVISIWDRIAFPLRRRGDTLHRITAPRDAMGAPQIESMNVDDYIRSVSRETASRLVEIDHLKMQKKYWQCASGILIAVVLLLAM